MFNAGNDASVVAGVIERPRLSRVLDAPFVRVCVLQGPSGSGKTTLVRSWARRQEDPPVTWVSVNAGLTSRKAFWEHVANSASRLGQLSEEAAAEIGAQRDLATDPVLTAQNVLAMADAAVLVLDGYEHLGEAMGEVDEDLSGLVRNNPALRVIITSRAPTRMADLLPGDGGITRVITLRELAFTAEEVGALLLDRTGIDDAHLAASVADATRGFPLTVRTVALSLSQLDRVPRVDSGEWNEVMAGQLASHLPSTEAVRFVIDTSVPPYVDAELASVLGETPNAAEMFDMLERGGFGRWVPYARDHQVFQYVETIRDTFRSRAKRDAERFRRSCLATAAWLLDHEEVVEQALQYAIEGGDYALADRVFVPLVVGNPDSYISDRFLPVLREVPEEALSEHPMLAFGLALALMSNPALRGEAPRVAEIAVASEAAHVYVEPSIDAFSLAAMQAVARRLALRFRDSGEAALAVVRSVEELDPKLLVPFGDHIGTILRQLSMSLFQGGRIDEALSAIERSVALCRTGQARDYSVVYVAGFRAIIGDLVRSRALSASIDTDAWPIEFRHSYMNGLGIVAEGHHRLDALDFDGAVDVLRDTQSYIHVAEFWPLLTAISLSARHGQGQALAEARLVARELSGPVAPPGVGDNVATERLIAALALACTAGGDQRTAARLLRDQPRDSPHLAQARISVLLAHEKHRNAYRLATELMDLPAHTIRSLAETQTAGAVAALRNDEPEVAWNWLSAAAVAWDVYGPRVHVALLPPGDRRRLQEFAEARDSTLLRRYLDVSDSQTRGNDAASVELTRRERVVLTALAEHGSVRDIAETLVLSRNTIKSQLQSVYRKLGVSSRQAALAVARDLGLLDRTRPER